MNDNLATLEHIKRTALDLAIRFGPKVLVAILILIAGFFASRWVSRWMLKSLARIDLEPPVRQLIARMAWAVCYALFLVMALQNLGVELLPLLAGLGVAGAGIALATQGVLSNLVAGLSIIFSKPFRVGEYISIVGVEGRVDVITLFSTTLGHPDRSRVVVPNRKIVGEILHNYGRIRQIDISVGVAYDTDLAAAFATIDEVLKANPRVLADPAPVVQAAQLAEWAVTLSIKPWANVPDRATATSELNAALLEAFRRRNILMPVPQREVRMLPAAASSP